MTEPLTRELLTSKIVKITEGGDFVEVLLQASPVRYRLDKHRRDLRGRLEKARQEGQALQVLVDWECQEILDLVD